MILRTAGPGPAFNPPLSTNRQRSKLSPEAMTAIAMSLAFHACVGGYLYAHRFIVMQLPSPPSGDRPLTIETITFPPATPPRGTHEKPQPPRQQAREPIRTHQAPPLTELDPGPTLVAPSGPGGQGTGEGLGLGTGPIQLVPTPPAPPRPKAILNPDWIRKPSGSQLADAYPDRALELGRAGSVTLLCVVGVSGQVRDCNVAEETPRQFGFGAAALRLSRWFSIRPQTEDGQPVDGALVRVPIQFGAR